MIEKLDKKMEFVEISVLGNKKAECLDFEAGRRLNLKINELVDAVNELQLSIKPILEERESGIKVYEEAHDVFNNTTEEEIEFQKSQFVWHLLELVEMTSVKLQDRISELIKEYDCIFNDNKQKGE